MNDELFELVSTYITTNILQSQLWDAATDTVKHKAVANAYEGLTKLLPDIFKDTEPAVDDLAQQTIFLLKIDDSFQRAELGVVQMSIDGMTLIFRDRDYTISPYISGKYNITVVNGKRRRTAAYAVDPWASYRIPIDNTVKRWEGY